MNKNNANPAELTNLIDQAQQVVVSQAERQSSQKTRRSNPLIRMVIPLTILLLLGYLSFKLWVVHIPPSKEKVSADLEQILYVARDAVEGARSADGKLPESIPNASIAAVVEYDTDSQRYKLSTAVMGVRVTLEQDEKTITQYGAEK